MGHALLAGAGVVARSSGLRSCSSNALPYRERDRSCGARAAPNPYSSAGVGAIANSIVAAVRAAGPSSGRGASSKDSDADGSTAGGSGS
jgi:hypothetical protein